ncbi:MAG: Hpt domain-containing protein [Chloroflexota bacterium]|nr:MAG: Hpt domain-containing protein [Chloroflexota bacterium]
MDLVPEFLMRRREDIASIESGVRAGTFSDIRRMGHIMKGAGGAYGFDAISEIGAAIELAAKQSDSPAVTALAARLGSYLDRLEVVPDS